MEEIFAGRKFLVVDDEPDLREILRDELEFAGAELSEAENGVQAMALAQQQDFDAIISDIRMPGGDGMTLARGIKSREGHVPVMFLVTGFADIAPAEAYEIGVEGFIYKPFNLGPVIENLARVLTDSEKRWQNEVKVTNSKELAIKGNLADLMQSEVLKLGRGGFFVRGSFLDVRTADVVKLNLDNQVSIVGVVRWLQHEAEKNLPTGLGVEILSLSPAASATVVLWLNENKPKSYIPRK